jgi:hypothetical protein
MILHVSKNNPLAVTYNADKNIVECWNAPQYGSEKNLKIFTFIKGIKMKVIYLDNNKELIDLAKKIYSYTGKKFKVITQNYYHLGNYWNEGSIEYCVLVSRLDGSIHYPSNDTTNPFKAVAHESFEIPKNHFILAHDITRGKDMGINVYCREDEIDNVLPKQEEIKLTKNEEIVLNAFKALKSNYRKNHCLNSMFLLEYENAIVKLKELDLISRNNAITTKGKNYAQSY